MTSNADAVLIGFIVTVSVVGLLATVSLVVFVCFKWKQFVKRRAGTRGPHHQQQGHHRRHHSRRRRARNSVIMIQESSTPQYSLQMDGPPAYDSINEPPPPYSLVDTQPVQHASGNGLPEHTSRSESVNSTSRFNTIPSYPGSVMRAHSGSVRNGRISSNQIMLSHTNTPLATPACSRRGRRMSFAHNRVGNAPEDTALHQSGNVSISNDNLPTSHFLSGHFSEPLTIGNSSVDQPPEVG